MMEIAGGALLNGLIGGVASSVIGSMLAPSKASFPMPTSKTTPMPTADDEAMQNAKKASITEQLSRRGRASTILTDQSDNTDKLGG